MSEENKQLLTRFMNNVEFLREQSGITIEDLCRANGMPDPAVYEDWLSGVSEPKMVAIDALCKQFNVYLEDLTKKDLKAARA